MCRVRVKGLQPYLYINIKHQYPSQLHRERKLCQPAHHKERKSVKISINIFDT